MPLFGAIFDADGVLFDSERQSFEALRQAMFAVSNGHIRLDPDRLDLYCGRDDDSLVRHMNITLGTSIDATHFRDFKLERFRRIIAQDPIAVAAGVVPLVDALDLARIPYAVATSAIRAKLETSLAAVGLKDRFKTVLSADDVTVSKPDPAIFLLAAKRLALEPRRIVVFEDTVNGVLAANRAGMFSVAISGTFPRDQLSGACRIIDSLREVGVPDLKRWIDHWNSKPKGDEVP